MTRCHRSPRHPQGAVGAGPAVEALLRAGREPTRGVPDELVGAVEQDPGGCARVRELRLLVALREHPARVRRGVATRRNDLSAATGWRRRPAGVEHEATCGGSGRSPPTRSGGVGTGRRILLLPAGAAARGRRSSSQYAEGMIAELVAGGRCSLRSPISRRVDGRLSRWGHPACAKPEALVSRVTRGRYASAAAVAGRARRHHGRRPGRPWPLSPPGWSRRWSADDDRAVAGALEATGTADLIDRTIRRAVRWPTPAGLGRDGARTGHRPAAAGRAHDLLDINHQVELLELLRISTRESGKTIVIVLHDLNLACRYATTSSR